MSETPLVGADQLLLFLRRGGASAPTKRRQPSRITHFFKSIAATIGHALRTPGVVR